MRVPADRFCRFFLDAGCLGQSFPTIESYGDAFKCGVCGERYAAWPRFI